MPELPSVGQAVTGGAIGAVIAACVWIINQFRGAITDGEALAERRIAALTADFDAWRARAEEQQEAQRADLADLHRELSDYRRELGDARSQLRECDRKSHEQRRQIAGLKIEVDGLRSELKELKGDPPAAR